MTPTWLLSVGIAGVHRWQWKKITNFGAFIQHCGFISWRGRLTEVLVSAARGKREVRVGEAKWGYRLLIPGNWWDFKTIWYAISYLRQTWSGVASGSLWMTQMDQHSWKGSWWDWVCMGTGRSEFTPIYIFREHLMLLQWKKLYIFYIGVGAPG